MAKAKDEDAARYSHEESSAIVKRTMKAGFRNGYNVTLDGTGDGSEKSLVGKIDKARAAGMTVEGCCVTCPTDVAVARAIQRGATSGRVVPIANIENIHREVSRLFPKVAI